MILLLTILIPIISGLILPFLRLNDNFRKIYVSIFTLLTSVMAYFIFFSEDTYFIKLLTINEIFSFSFSCDGLSKIFCLLVATLWPLATLYAFDYMKHEGDEDSFFRYYMIAFGITLGVSFSNNLITMYLFYELLTFLTLPLIMHKKEDKNSLYAGKVYLILSIFGATLALIGIIILTMQTKTTDFIYGGYLSNNLLIDNKSLLYVGYGLCFLGFGVKAAILPFSFWLPVCSVAPTPVTALLHAVAVVKAGVFAIMRVTFYSYGFEFLQNTLVQNICLVITILTMLYGSIMAVKETHLKRRFAYSTVSNLSYILFAILLLTADGLSSAITHMVFHGIIKITIFMVIGAILVYTGSTEVKEIKNYAKYMKWTFATFTIASIALIGIPLTCGFISKFSIAEAAIANGSKIAIVGLGSIVLSSILTTIYTFTIIVNAYFPTLMKDSNSSSNTQLDIKDPSLYMLIPFIILIIMIIYFGISSSVLVDFINNVAFGL